MKAITYDNLSVRLIEELPELESKYESEIEWWGDEKPGAHIIFGDLLNPYLISLLESGTDEKVLKKIFAFLEQLANQEDVKIQEVVAVTVLERLGANKSWLKKASKYMGRTTLKFSNELESFWGPDDSQSLDV